MVLKALFENTVSRKANLELSCKTTILKIHKIFLVNSYLRASMLCETDTLSRSDFLTCIFFEMLHVLYKSIHELPKNLSAVIFQNILEWMQLWLHVITSVLCCGFERYCVFFHSCHMQTKNVSSNSGN